MKTTTIDIDWEDVASAMFLILLFAFAILIPPAIGYMLWIALAPVGFWQIMIATVFIGFVITVLYIVEIIILAIIATLSS